MNKQVFIFSVIRRKGIQTIFLSVFVLWINFSLSSQTYNFQHYKVDNGLPQSVILSIYQDTEGFIWIGTQSGLSRFDGYEFVNYFNEPLDPSSVSNSWIYDITSDSSGYLYLATKGGLNKFDKKTGAFSVLEYYIPDSSTNFSFVYGITARDNILYISTPPTLTIYNTLTGQKESFKNNFKYEGNVHDQGSCVLYGSDNKLWITSHNGLSVFDLTTKTFRNYHFNQDLEGLNRNNNVTALFEEKNGNIIVGTEYGLFLIQKGENKTRRLLSIQEKLGSIFIRSLARDKDNNLWIATEGGGLSKFTLDSLYHPETINTYRSSQGFVNHDIAYSIYIDRSDNLWLGSIAGLDKVNLKKSGIRLISSSGAAESYDILDNIIASVFIDPSQRLWIGNWGKGLNILDKNRDQESILHYQSELNGKFHIPENHVHVIFKDSRGRIYIGTRDGISVYRETKGDFVPAHEYFDNPEYDCFSGIRVYCMMEDRAGRIWVGTGNGITILDIPSNSKLVLNEESAGELNLNSNLVYSIMQDKDGDIWITTSNGLNRYSTSSGTMHSISNDPSSTNTLCSNFTISLCEDKLGYIWIGTGSGLNRYSKKDSSFLYFSRSNGLPSELIYNIISDNDGNLWFTTAKGLVSLDPEKAEEGNFRIIDHLKGEEFNIKAVYKSVDGEMFFGGLNGLFSFYPDSIRKNMFIPPVRITSFQKENDGKLELLNTYLDKITLNYRDYAFSIEFSALDYTDPAKNNYYYKMEGLSDKWISLGERRFVHFTNLAPGTYNFMVKGSNNDGIWNEQPTSLRIRINPPWWVSPYAYAVYVLLVIVLVIFIIYYRERTLRKEKRRLEIEVARRTSEIARQKQDIEESEQKLSSTINSLDDIVFVLDEKGRLQEFYNPRQRKTHFILPDKDLGKHYMEISFPEDVMSQLKNAFDTFGYKTGITEFDHHFRENGNVFWYNTKISPKINASGKLTGLVIVAREITDRKESEELLTRQKEKLDELNSTKDKFFSILAHDLKNPFTHLHSLGELLVKNYGQLDESDKIEALKKIHQSSGFIFELLENLLTWSRTQRDKIEFNPASFDLQNLISVNVNLNKIQAENKGITIINETAGELKAFGDRDMINTVIRNLLNNAVKFCSNGEKIYIKVKKEKDRYLVSIRDEGVGISKEDQRKLFHLDEKYKSTGTAGETGTGLGLVICREFIEKNGGTIWCESKQGEGTVFYFTLARKP